MLIVVGASAGGVEALRSFAAGLPQDLAAAVLVVLHLPTGGISVLAPILNRAGPLRATVARGEETLKPGHILVAPPDHHLVVVGAQAGLSSEPSEDGHRPSINVLFRSAAVAAGRGVVGVLLSGALDDGVEGLASIAGRGGIVIVQDPAEAQYPSMPAEAIRRVDVDHVLRVGEMGNVLAAS